MESHRILQSSRATPACALRNEHRTPGVRADNLPKSSREHSFPLLPLHARSPDLTAEEFLQNDEAGFQAPSTPQDSRLALTKAQSFYDRILDGYGDDSIGELGGAHLALEQVSILATKVLEDARIGGSPLEKSTRYVSFAQQVVETSILQRPTGAGFCSGRTLSGDKPKAFRTYAELIEPVRDYLRKVLPPNLINRKPPMNVRFGHKDLTCCVACYRPQH